MPDRAEASLPQLCHALEEALKSTEGAERASVEQKLVWCRVEQGALGSAFELLWSGQDASTDRDERRLLRAELQAFCGNEESALRLLAETPAAAGEFVRARVAAARGDWAEVARCLVEAEIPQGTSTRASCLAVRALTEEGEPERARELLGTLSPSTHSEVLEHRLCEARLSDDPSESIAELVREAQTGGALRIAADAWADLSTAHIELGADEAAREAAVRAVELWDDMATSLPPPLRAGFWSDARREAMRATAKRKKTDTPQRPRAGLTSLLSNLRALASERDLGVLLGVITEGAVALSGAERGFVLLANESGELEPETIRTAEDHLGPETAAFSRSIAETVLIDRDPIITVDAYHDARVQDFLSVHQLMLKSVACLPIETRGRTWGVLYLEHRSRSGRFSGTDLSLLRAYADQAAIAIETSWLLDRVANQKNELLATNEALRVANAQLEKRVQGQAEALHQTRREVDRLRGSKSPGERWGLIGGSDGMRRVYEILDRLATSDVPVVITGESGTGKELVARAIHNSGARAEQPFVSLSCGAVPEELLESELFGHGVGAFTGATRARDGLFVQAEGGTLFMDEIADMPMRMQLDLLRVLQENRVRPLGENQDRSIDVRLVTACKYPLSNLVAEGKMREDLYYRIAVVEIPLPPLRERPEDIPLLCEHFLTRVADERGEEKKSLSRDALRRLKLHSYPGNVRELEHILLNATVFAAGDVIEAEELTIETGEQFTAPTVETDNFRDFKAAERARIVSTLNAHDWNRAKAARALGMARRTFYRRLKEHGIELPKG